MARRSHYEKCIERLREGDLSARDELLNRSCNRLEKLARKILKDFPELKRWVETDDVMQSAALRLWRSLEDVKPESIRHFFNLAALQVRRELIEMSRHFSSVGLGGPYVSTGPNQDSRKPPVHVPGETTSEPQKLATWTQFHEQVGKLPDKEREVFHLLWYQELLQSEVAELLDVSERTVKRRWQSARLKLFDVLKDGLPGL